MIERWIKNPQTLKRWRRFQKNRRAVISVWIFALFLLISITAELWANSKPLMYFHEGRLFFPVYQTIHPSTFDQSGIFVTDYRKLQADPETKGFAIWPLVEWDPFESNKQVDSYPAPPSWENLLGTDDRGRDVLARLLYGFRYSIGYALLVWLVSYGLGIVLGSIMGFSGGMTDLLGQRAVEVFESMPVFLLLITMISIFGSSLWLLVFFSSVFGWMMISIYIRAEFLKLRKREYVEAAQAMGVPRSKIILRHILPNALGPVITFSPFAIAAGISGLANLDYLGFGLPPPTPSWGELMQQAYQNFTTSWWLIVYSGLAICITLTVLNFIGEGIRDAFDPRKV